MTSKKYQAIEKEKMKDLKDREKKLNKDRSLFLSIQTAQRQKAMEEKKRIMLEAEEQRRRKALEDRRRFQQQATERFRSAINRVKVPKNAAPCAKNNFMQGNMKVKTTRCLHQLNTFLVEAGRPVDLSKSSPGRLTMGKDVEVAQGAKTDFVRRTPSLDDVLGQLQGDSESTDTPHVSNLRPDNNMKLTDNTSMKTPETNLKKLVDADALEHTTGLKFDHASTLSDGPGSPTIPDSLNSSVVESDIDLKHLQPLVNTPTMLLSEKERRQCFETSIEEQQPYYACVDDSDASTVDSLDECDTNCFHHKYKSPLERAGHFNQKKKVVGILKKSRTSDVSSVDRFRYNNSYQDIPCDTSSDTDQSQFVAKSQKKVRFSDKVIVNEKRNSTPAVMNITDSVQIELWKTVFPKEFLPSSIPNNAFTPKMRCSLSSNATTAQDSSKRPLSSPGVYIPTVQVNDHVAGRVKQSSPDNQNLEVNDVYDSPDEVGNGPSLSQSFDKMPTDSDINNVWDQIRRCLQDDKKVSVPPRVFNFRPPTENRRAFTDNYRKANHSVATPPGTPVNSKLLSTAARKTNVKYATRKQLVYRQPNQSRLKIYADIQPHAVPVPGIQQEQVTMDRSNMKSSNKEPAKSRSNSNCDNAGTLTSLSLEEQRLMQSIERINQRLKDHLVLPDGSAEVRKGGYYPVHAPPTWPRTHSPGHVRTPLSDTKTKGHETMFRSNSVRTHSTQIFRKQSSHIT